MVSRHISAAGAALLSACLGFWVLGASAQGGTTLQVANATGSAVPVMVTLGAGQGINNVNQIPWGIKQVGSPLQGIFTLGANQSVSFNSGSKSFSGNIAFGPTFNSRGCGSTAANACYPNSTTLAEFSLNMPGETVDLSGVNGTNALITMNLSGSPWNDGAGGHTNVTKFANQPISGWTPSTGVYGWQATTCTAAPNPPNPTSSCPAPKNRPSAAQLQSKAQCNVQRGGPTGGTVQIVFTGYAPGSAPPANCN
jgi:hypothetical protein